MTQKQHINSVYVFHGFFFPPKGHRTTFLHQVVLHEHHFFDVKLPLETRNGNFVLDLSVKWDPFFLKYENGPIALLSACTQDPYSFLLHLTALFGGGNRYRALLYPFKGPLFAITENFVWRGGCMMMIFHRTKETW